MIIWLVVDLPFWKIWVRQLRWLFPMYGKIKFMFQTTNHWCMGHCLASPWALTMIMGLSPWPATHLKGHSLMSACTMGSANLRPIKRFASKTLGWFTDTSLWRNMIFVFQIRNREKNTTVSWHIIAQPVGRDMCSLSWSIMIKCSRLLMFFTLQLARIMIKWSTLTNKRRCSQDCVPPDSWRHRR